MKNIVLSLLFTVSGQLMFSQGSLTFTGDTVITEACEGYILFDTIKIYNNTDHDVPLRWIRRQYDFPRGGNGFLIVDPYQYLPFTSTHGFLIYPHDSSQVIFHVWPDTMLAGDSIIWQLEIYDETDSAQTSALITAIAVCPLVSDVDDAARKDELIFFPNPFSIEATLRFPGEKFDQFSIFDFTGRPLRTIPVFGNELILSREKLGQGVYFGCLYDQNQLVGQVKMFVID